MDNKVVGENIRVLRENAGFTQSNIAGFMKVDQSFVSKVEKGERSLSSDMLEKLATLFGVAVDQIESESMTALKLSFAFRGSEFTPDEMEAFSAVNKIALNSEFMRVILKEARS